MSRSKSLRLAITGDQNFAHRHRFLFEAIARRCSHVAYVTSTKRTVRQRLRLRLLEARFVLNYIVKSGWRIPRRVGELRLLRRRFTMSETAFEAKSICTQDNLNRLEYAPDLVLHIFGLYRPFWKPSKIPFVHYLDYTTALAQRNWPPNLPKLSPHEYARWFSLERATYQAAAHVFTMSSIAARSIVDDYGVLPERVTAVGSGGSFGEPFDGRKSLGSKQVLFNANPFGRKGGDIALAAFELVRREIPEAKLVVIGLTLDHVPPGVVNPGYVSGSGELRRLFLGSDLVVAPARADPFPGFLIEAMSHGVPCIASSVDGMPEIVDHGHNGILIDSPDAASLARAVVDLLRDDRRLEAFSAAALAKAGRCFAWSGIADRIVDVLLRERDLAGPFVTSATDRRAL